MRNYKLALFALGLLACADKETDAIEFRLNINAVDDRGGAITGIAVRVGETRIGKTAENGELRAIVKAFDGQVFDFLATCPDDYSSEDIPKKVVFRDTRGLEGMQSQTMNFEIRCVRDKRVVAVLVHADGHSGMPVLVDGVPSGVTDGQGYAHLRLDVKPHTQFEVSLDSSHSPELLPGSPRQLMTVGEEDSLFIFDPAFTRAPPPEKKKRRSRRKKTVPTVEVKKRPVRID